MDEIDELDTFFIDTLKKILEITKDDADYVKDFHSEEYKEIQEDYEYTINQLTELLKTVKTIDDLAMQDEETITDVYDYIATYADNFVISCDPAQKQKDLEQYDKLEEILDLFLDSDDDDFEDEDEDS